MVRHIFRRSSCFRRGGGFEKRFFEFDRAASCRTASDHRPRPRRPRRGRCLRTRTRGLGKGNPSPPRRGRFPSRILRLRRGRGIRAGRLRIRISGRFADCFVAGSFPEGAKCSGGVFGRVRPRLSNRLVAPRLARRRGGGGVLPAAARARPGFAKRILCSRRGGGGAAVLRLAGAKRKCFRGCLSGSAECRGAFNRATGNGLRLCAGGETGARGGAFRRKLRAGGRAGGGRKRRGAPTGGGAVFAQRRGLAGGMGVGNGAGGGFGAGGDFRRCLCGAAGANFLRADFRGVFAFAAGSRFRGGNGGADAGEGGRRRNGRTANRFACAPKSANPAGRTLRRRFCFRRGGASYALSCRSQAALGNDRGTGTTGDGEFPLNPSSSPRKTPHCSSSAASGPKPTQSPSPRCPASPAPCAAPTHSSMSSRPAANPPAACCCAR